MELETSATFYTIAAITFPIIGFFIILFSNRKTESGTAVLATISSLMSFFAAATAAYVVFPSKSFISIDISWFIFNIIDTPSALHVNSESVILLCIISFITTIFHVYSIDICRYTDHKLNKQKFLFILLYQTILLIAVLSSSLLQFYIFISILTILETILVMQENKGSASIKWLFLINMFADLLLLAGVIVLNVHNYNIQNILTFEGLSIHNQFALLSNVWILIVLSVLIKSGVFPAYIFFKFKLNNLTLPYRLVTSHMLLPLYILYLAMPLLKFIPTYYMYGALIFILICIFVATIQTLHLYELDKIALNLFVATTAFILITMILFHDKEVFLSISPYVVITFLTILGTGYIGFGMHTNSINEISCRTPLTKAITWLSFAGFAILLGVFPLNGFWRNCQILAHNREPLFTLLFISAAISACFALFRLIVKILNKPKKEIWEPEKNRFSTIPFVLLGISLLILIPIFEISHSSWSHIDLFPYQGHGLTILILLLIFEVTALLFAIRKYTKEGNPTKSDSLNIESDS